MYPNSLILLSLVAVSSVAARAFASAPRVHVLALAGLIACAIWNPMLAALLFGGAAWTALAAPWVERNARAAPLAATVLIGYSAGGIWLISGAGPLAGLASLASARPTPWVPVAGAAALTIVACRYLIDLAAGRVQRVGWLELFAHLTFLPALLLGPLWIVDRSLTTERRPSWLVDADAGVKLIAVGLVLKLAVTDPLSVPLRTMFSRDVSAIHARDAWVMAAGFGLQFYGEFAAWLMVGTGIARLLGVSVGAAWSFPLISKSVSEFWFRWHPSLLHALALREPSARYRRFAIGLAIVIAGLWVGFGVRYAAWGIYQGTCVVVWELLASTAAGRWLARLPIGETARRIVGVPATLATVWLGGLFLRADSAREGLALTIRAFSPASSRVSPPLDLFAVQVLVLTALTVAVAALFPVVDRWRAARGASPVPIVWTALGGIACGICAIGAIAFWPL